jgi:hypothetical protein
MARGEGRMARWVAALECGVERGRQPAVLERGGEREDGDWAEHGGELRGVVVALNHAATV